MKLTVLLFSIVLFYMAGTTEGRN